MRSQRFFFSRGTR